MITVGLCEDDDALRGILKAALAREGWVVRATASGSEAVLAFGADPPDVLLLDIGLPDADGRDVCQALRARGIAVPVLFLTARDAVPDRLSGFQVGGDDYLTKPFVLAEVVLRVGALLRRSPRSVEGADAGTETSTAGFALGELLDPSAHGISPAATTAGGVRLTPTEFRILAALCGDPSVVRRQRLIAAAWPDGARVSENTLDAYVSRLRSKLRQAGRPERIENVRGVGYTLR